MAITPPAPASTPPDEKKIQEWIVSAPDGRGTGQPEPKRTMKGKQAQISLALPPDLLERLDAFVANNPTLKRNGAINIAIRQMLEQGIIVNFRPVEAQP